VGERGAIPKRSYRKRGNSCSISSCSTQNTIVFNRLYLKFSYLRKRNYGLAQNRKKELSLTDKVSLQNPGKNYLMSFQTTILNFRLYLKMNGKTKLTNYCNNRVVFTNWINLF